MRIFNEYGPTETVVGSCAYQIGPRDPERGPVPVGWPIAGTLIRLLDATAQPVPDGMAGEIYIGGAGVGDGYLNRAELTSERFAADPFGPGRLYRTGDRGRWRLVLAWCTSASLCWLRCAGSGPGGRDRGRRSASTRTRRPWPWPGGGMARSMAGGSRRPTWSGWPGAEALKPDQILPVPADYLASHFVPLAKVPVTRTGSDRATLRTR